MITAGVPNIYTTSGLRTYNDNIICMRVVQEQRFWREGYSVLNGEMSLLQLGSLSAYRTRCMRECLQILL